MMDQKTVVVSDMVPVMSKITDHKLSTTNYREWRHTIELYLLSISMDSHLTDEPPSDESKNLPWLREDARLYLQIRNSITSEVVGMISHCKIVKTLMAYLEFMYSGKGNLNHIYDVCQAFYKPDRGDKSLTDYFMEFKKTYEELNMLLPLSTDVTIQQTQREQMAVMSFLAGLSPEFETAKSQILSDSKISSLEDAFTRILRTVTSALAQTVQANSVLFSRESGKQLYRPNGGNKGPGTNKVVSTRGHENIICHYCRKPGHLKCDCHKLQFKNAQSTHVVTSSEPSDNAVMISAEEYSKLLQRPEAPPLPPTHVTALAESGNPSACLVSSSSPKWVIDFGATNYMTGSCDGEDYWLGT